MPLSVVGFLTAPTGTWDLNNCSYSYNGTVFDFSSLRARYNNPTFLRRSRLRLFCFSDLVSFALLAMDLIVGFKQLTVKILEEIFYTALFRHLMVSQICLLVQRVEREVIVF